MDELRRLVAGDLEPSLERLYADLVKINPAVPRVIGEIVDEVESYDPGLLPSWEQEGLRPKLVTYVVRYVLPFYELLSVGAQPKYVKLLTAELLGCVAWRAFDNCVDAHEPPQAAHRTSVLSCLRLVDYVESNFAVRASRQIQQHYVLMSEQAVQETERPIALADIWKRCSIFCYAPESLAELAPDHLSVFRNYINYAGLAHDLNDFVSDISSQVKSLPVFWFGEVNERGALTVDVVEALYARARNAVVDIETEFARSDVAARTPLLGRLLEDAARTFGGR